jgi:hypothetical protein
LARFAVLASATPASAHHSPVMFDQSKTVTLTGTVRLFQWTNPHCYIQVLVDDGGRQTEWNMEMGAPVYLFNRGWRPSTLKPGRPDHDHRQPAAQRRQRGAGAQRYRCRRQAGRTDAVSVAVALRPCLCAVAAGWLACIAAPACAGDADSANHADWNGVWFTEQGARTQISGFLSAEDARRGNQLPLIDLSAPWT